MFARLIAVVIVLVAGAAEAQTRGNYLAGLTEVSLRVVDAVKGGCWPRPEETKREVELELIRSKLSVVALKFRVPIIRILSAGGSSGTHRCFINYDFKAYYCDNLLLPFNNKLAMLCPTLWSSSGTASGPKATTQSEINKNFVTAVRAFLHGLEMDRLGKKAK